MKNRKLSMLLMVFLAVAMLLTACGGKEETKAPEQGEASKPASGEAEYKMTFAHVSAESTSTHQGALKLKELLEKNSDGRIEMEVYPNAQLGGDRELIEGVQRGEITMMLSSPAPQVNFVPSCTIYDTPFVFQNLAQGRATLEDPDFVAAISEEYGKSGFQYLGASGQGFRTLTSHDPVHTPDDVKGMTIRTMENKFHMETWKLLGANPTPLPFNELYTALQQGVADAQENPIELIHSQKFYEQQKYIMNTNHILQTNCWIMNKDYFDALPEDLQQIVRDATTEAVAFTNQYNDDNEERYIQEIKDYGCEFVELTPEELDLFTEMVTPVYDSIKAETAPEVYETYFKSVEKNKDL